MIDEQAGQSTPAPRQWGPASREPDQTLTLRDQDGDLIAYNSEDVCDGLGWRFIRVKGRETTYGGVPWSDLDDEFDVAWPLEEAPSPSSVSPSGENTTPVGEDTGEGVSTRERLAELINDSRDGADLYRWNFLDAADAIIAAGWRPPLPDSETERVLSEVAAERARQDAKWGEQNHPDGTGPDGTLFGVYFSELANMMRDACDLAARENRLTWAHIAAEEALEALAEKDQAKLRAELVQVAAVAVNWIGAIDRREVTS